MNENTKPAAAANLLKIAAAAALNSKSPLDLAPLAPLIAAAVTSQLGTDKKWKVVGIGAYKQGVRVAMLRPTITNAAGESVPNPEYCEGTKNTIDAYIIGTLTASCKPEKFDAVQPWATGADAMKSEAHWTIAEVLSLTTAQLREISVTCKMVGRAKREYTQRVGSLFALVRKYVDQYENPEKVVVKREAKTNPKGKTAADAPLLDRMVSLLAEFNANVLGLKDDTGKTLPNVIAAHEAGLDLLAKIGQMRKTK